MENWKSFIPIPVLDEKPQYNELYEKAWELAYKHIKHIDGMPQTPYMDEAFCDTQIWIWDSCFMAFFCKYGKGVFPGIETLRNFYEVLYNGNQLAKVIPTEDEPEWTFATPGEPYELKIHIADNPPLFAWAEHENALMSGDVNHIKELLYEHKFLQKHYDWIEGLRESVTPDGVHAPTCLIAEDKGYRWEGGRSGMDNTPRGRTGEKAEKIRPNNPDMLWIDAICQQALSAKVISKLFQFVDDKENAEIWTSRFLEKKEIINKYYWDGEDKFYYDIDCNTNKFYKIMSIASYWTMTAGVADKEQAESLLRYLLAPEFFGGSVPFVSVARCDADFIPEGEYWRGGVWLPTAYAALKGLLNYGFIKEAREMSVALLDHMQKTYIDFEPHTIWEAYSPTDFKPSTTENVLVRKYVRPDFCGWSALGPISIYIEFILGFHTVDAFEKRVEWSKPETDGRIGIKNLRFGNVVTDIVSFGDKCFVKSNESYTLSINGTDYQILQGENEICFNG